MRTQIYRRFIRLPLPVFHIAGFPRQFPSKSFHSTSRLRVIKPYLLADIGEGIRECEIIQWFVEPEARVEEWDKLCEVQSDKASVEITSRFSGVVKKLYYDAGEMAQVGKPLMDIDIQGEIKREDLEVLSGATEGEESQAEVLEPATPSVREAVPITSSPPNVEAVTPIKGKHATLATPAVRHLTKELDVNLEDVTGTGRDGRVLKDDVYQHAKQRDNTFASPPSSPQTPQASTSSIPASGPQQETAVQLSSTQHQMFKTMTKSLSIPHFLYADEIDFTRLSDLRTRLNRSLAKNPINGVSKLSYLPFIIKAVSMSLHQHPILNARLDIDPTTSKPLLIMRSHHHIGVAIDTPTGLLVPVIKNVSSLSILSLALELSRLQSLAHSGKLSTADLSGGTLTISNIGSIGGTYVAPVIVERQLAILGAGKIREVPAFDDTGALVRKQVCNFSWSADHRVVDGATMARAAEVVRTLVEEPESMVVHLR